MFNNKKEVNKARSEMNILIHQVRVETQRALDAVRKEIDEIKKLVGEDSSSFSSEKSIFPDILGLCRGSKTPKNPSIIERINKMEDFLGVVYTVEKHTKKGYTKIKNNKKNK